MLRFCCLGSGSEGNALVVEARDGPCVTRVLVDDGFRPEQLAARLARARLALEDFDAVFVTHEHSDHAAGVVALLTFSFVAASKGVLNHLPTRLPGLQILKEWGSTYTLFVLRWRSTLVAAGLSCVMLGLYFLTFYFSALALGLGLPLTDFFAVMPIVDLVAALPVSLGGFGVREGAFVTLLGQLLKVPAAEAVSLSLLGALASLAWGCVGLALLPAYRREVRTFRQ